MEIAANTPDGSCWVAFEEEDMRYTELFVPHTHVAKINPDLSWSSVYFFEQDVGPLALEANPIDGSCWLGVDGYVIKLNADGSEAFRIGAF